VAEAWLPGAPTGSHRADTARAAPPCWNLAFSPPGRRRAVLAQAPPL